MFTMGFAVALGLLFTLAKIPWRWKLAVVSHPVISDLLVFVFLMTMHWGSFSGVMVATIGALFCSMTLSLARKAIGHVSGDLYYRGWFDVKEKLQ